MSTSAIVMMVLLDQFVEPLGTDEEVVPPVLLAWPSRSGGGGDGEPHLREVLADELRDRPLAHRSGSGQDRDLWTAWRAELLASPDRSRSGNRGSIGAG